MNKLTALTSIALVFAASITISYMGSHTATAKSNNNSSHASTAASQYSPFPQLLTRTTIYALGRNNVLYALKLGDGADWETTLGSTTFNKIGTISNVQGIVTGIDFRPADGNLYALANGGSSLYIINPADASATLVSNLSPAIGNGDRNKILFDFNPTADAIRLISDNDLNYAIAKNAAGIFNTVVPQTSVFYSNVFDFWFGISPNVVVGAYTNNRAGAQNTLFYGFDSLSGFLVTIEDRNAGGSSNTGGGRLRTIANVYDGTARTSFGSMDIITDPQSGANLAVGLNFNRLLSFDLGQVDALNLPPDQVQNIFANGVFVNYSDGNEYREIVDVAAAPIQP